MGAGERTEGAAMYNQDAYDLANRKARATHRNWIVWCTEGNYGPGIHWEAAEISEDSLARAVAAVGPEGKFALVQHRKPYYWIARPSVVPAWIANLKAGQYSH
jgi:hypothetical protein